MNTSIPSVATPIATDFSQYSKLRAGAKTSDPTAIKHAAQQFESLFTQMMLKTMRATHFGDDGLGEQGDVYQDMADQQLALQISSGRGIGLADMMVRQLQLGKMGTAGTKATAGIASPSASTGAASTAPASAASTQDPSVSAAARQQFVSSIQPYAEKAAAQLGIPSRVLIAQAALETGWGQHVMKDAKGNSSNNLFGIKASAGWNGAQVAQNTQEYVDGKAVTETAQFRSYASLGDAFGDYVQFLKSNPRYADALRAGGDGRGFAQGLQSAGYATDPNYAGKILQMAYSPTVNAALAATSA